MKGINLYYVAAVCFLIGGVIGILNDRTESYAFVALGVTFFAIGSSEAKKSGPKGAE